MKYSTYWMVLYASFAAASTLSVSDKRRHRSNRRERTREFTCAVPGSQAARFLRSFRLLWVSMQGRTECSATENPFSSLAENLAANPIWSLEVSLVRNSIPEKAS